MLDLSEKNFLEIFEEVFKTRSHLQASQNWTNQTGLNNARQASSAGTLKDEQDG